MTRWSPYLRVLGALALRAVTGAVLIYLVLQNWNLLALDWTRFNIGLILLSTLLYPFVFGAMVVIWHQIMRLQIGSTDWRRDTRIYCYTNLVRSLPLGLFWRIGGRTVLYLKANVSSQPVIAGSLWEMILHALSALLIFCSIWIFRPIAVDTWIWVFAIAAVFIAVVIAFRRIGQYLNRDTTSDWRGALQELRMRWWTQGKSLAFILILNGATWFIAAVNLQLLVYAIAPQVPFDYLDALQTWLIVGMAGYVVVALSFLDVGAREATMVLVLSGYMPPTPSIVIAILTRLIMIAGDWFWSLIGLLLIRANSDAEAEHTAKMQSLLPER